jgi:hypothetical protein
LETNEALSTVASLSRSWAHNATGTLSTPVSGVEGTDLLASLLLLVVGAGDDGRGAGWASDGATLGREPKADAVRPIRFAPPTLDVASDVRV